MLEFYSGRREIRRDGRDYFAEVIVRASACDRPSAVILSESVLRTLRDVFGPDFEHHRHCVCAAVSAQIAAANVAGEMPHVGAASFHAEVVGVRLSGDAGREVSGFLLTVAGMDAIGHFLCDWESIRAADA